MPKNGKPKMYPKQGGTPFTARMIRSHDGSKSIVWTNVDEARALKQGWGLFDYDCSGIVVILRMDDPPAHEMWRDGWPTDTPFGSDDEALGYVRARADFGDDTAIRALELHEWNAEAAASHRERQRP